MTKVKFLSIDPGLQYLGVAISHHGKLSEGLTTIQETSINQQFKKISQIINDYNPERIIIGCPKRGSTKKYSAQLGKKIKSTLNIPIVYVNEDKTSIQAKDIISKSKKNPKKIHQISAAAILQNYIDDLIQ